MKTEEGKTIKDYLHLYLGIDVQMDGETVGKLLGYSVRNLEEDEIMILYTVQMGEEEDDWAVYNDDEKTQRIKPILRPLSDMTEEEKIEFITASKDWRYYKEIANIRDSPEGLIHECKYKRGTHVIQRVQPLESFDAAQFIYLLSKHFDLFGLIESGLAIDNNKTKSQ